MFKLHGLLYRLNTLTDMHSYITYIYIPANAAISGDYQELQTVHYESVN